MSRRTASFASSTLKVLYVEDYPPSAVLVRHTLSRHAPNIELEIVTTVAQAIERLNCIEPAAGHLAIAEAARPPNYDVVLTDLGLPDGSGLDVLAHVRTRHPELAVVITSSSVEEDTARDALRAGAYAYIAKRDDYLLRLPQLLRAAAESPRAEARPVLSPPPPA